MICGWHSANSYPDEACRPVVRSRHSAEDAMHLRRSYYLVASLVLLCAGDTRRCLRHSAPGKLSRTEFATMGAPSTVPLESKAPVAPPMQQLTAAKHSGKAPGWAVGYGQEFWRSPPNDSEIHAQPNAKPITPCSVNLGDVIERVSHALESTADGGAGVQTKNYAASFAGSGFTLSAHRPADTAKGELLAPGLIDAFSM